MDTDEDRKWFEALRSGVADQNDPAGVEALKLRDAILHSRRDLGEDSSSAVEHGLQRLRFRIRSEGLALRGNDSTSRPNGSDVRAVFRRRPEIGSTPASGQGRGEAEIEVPDWLRRSKGSKGSPSNHTYRNAGWAVAASVVVSVAVLASFQHDRSVDDERLVLRGEGSAVIQVVGEPIERAKDLVRVLLDAGALPTTTVLDDGRVQIRVYASVPVLDALQEQRLEPIVKDGYVTVVLAPISQKP